MIRLVLPELIRRHPGRVFELRYGLVGPDRPALRVGVREAALRCGLRATRDAGDALELSWRTLVFGVVAREVDEEVHVSVRLHPEGAGLLLRCVPQRTHDAHAAGGAAVIGLAGLMWAVGGWTLGVLPAATTLVAGGLLTDYARELAMAAFERRLRHLLVDIGGEMWPGLQAEVLPRSGRSIGRGLPYP